MMNRVFLSGHRVGFWIMRLRGSAGLLHTGNGSPETATGTAGHGGSNLRKIQVAQVLPDSDGFGSQVARVLLDRPKIGLGSPESHCHSGFQFWPPELRHLSRRVTASLPSSSLSLSLSLSLSRHLFLSSASRSLSVSPSPFVCVLRKHREERRRKKE
jgi:hypothetical protein